MLVLFVLIFFRKILIIMTKKIRIGFIGTGFARKVQIPAFAMCEDVEFTAIASANLENAERVAKEFNIPHFTDNWREVVESENVDLVCITTPPNLHYEQTLYALQHNKHILCEKPMAMNIAEAEEMTKLASEKSLLTLIDHEMRFQAGRQKARQLLENNEIGKIRHVKYIFRAPHRGDSSIPWNWWSDINSGGGALGAIGSHIIDSLLWFLQTDISSVFCQLQTHVKERKTVDGEVKPVTTDDEANMILCFADSRLTEDATGVISLSMVEYPDYQHSIEFVGTEGSLKVLYLGQIFLTKAGETDWTEIEVKQGKSVKGIFDSGFPSAFVSFAPKIVEALQKGQTNIENAATFVDGLKVQKVLDAARESNEKGIQIKL